MSNRDMTDLWAYHDGTKHSLARLRADPHVLDWEILPRPFKVYPTLDPIPLARDLTGSQRPVLEALADDGRGPGDAGAPQVDVDLLAHLLYFTAGVLKRRSHAMGETFFRAAACTGNLHHVDVYLACTDLPGLDAGLYHFGPHDFALRRLRAADQRAALFGAAADEPHLRDAPAILVLTSTWWRNAWKYRGRAYRHAFWDAGTQLANLLALAAARRLPAHLVLGFADDAVNALLGLDVEHEAALALVALGSDARRAATPAYEAPAPLALETLPLSAREVAYPAIVAAHRASSLASPAEAAAWRSPPSSAERAVGDRSALVALDPRDEPVAQTVEAVILRRGSTRRFAREPIAFRTLSTILRAVSRGVPADFVAPGVPRAEPYLVVNAVGGTPPGTYAYDRTHDALLPLRAGSFRREAGFLGLGQQIPSDAAVDVFWLCDLSAMFGALGSRGYRAAQLEAAIAGGKAYLAAYALGLGASGLTFFDDDVTTFFSPHARGKSVMFLMAIGVPERAPQARASR
ncbi:MAG: SagB/ThcOx family dehydrogenase [Deltaproteobacteria bacterium]|nr:SagB/ThcOx family dehydrogenase [Deltaproteobacteria bacterium]